MLNNNAMQVDAPDLEQRREALRRRQRSTMEAKDVEHASINLHLSQGDLSNSQPNHLPTQPNLDTKVGPPDRTRQRLSFGCSNDETPEKPDPEFTYVLQLLQPDIELIHKLHKRTFARLLQQERGLSRLEEDIKRERIPKALRINTRISLSKRHREAEQILNKKISDFNSSLVQQLLDERKKEHLDTLADLHEMRQKAFETLEPLLLDLFPSKLHAFKVYLEMRLKTTFERNELKWRFENNRKRAKEIERQKRDQDLKENLLDTKGPQIRQLIDSVVDKKVKELFQSSGMSKTVQALKKDLAKIGATRGAKPATPRPVSGENTRNKKARDRFPRGINSKKNPRDPRKPKEKTGNSDTTGTRDREARNGGRHGRGRGRRGGRGKGRRQPRK